jgi:putative transposase
VSRFRFIAAQRASHPVSTLCRTLGVSRSGFHAWARREARDWRSPRFRSDQRLLAWIRRIHGASRGTYGAPRIHAELRAEGQRTGRKRVARLLRAAGLEGAHRRRFRRTTVRDASAPGAPDLVQRRFTADRPDALWVADITYIRTWAGWVYLAVVVDAFSRRVVGWSMRDDLRAELVVDACEMARWRRRPAAGLVHHSDQGSQPEFKGPSQRRGFQSFISHRGRACGRRGQPQAVPAEWATWTLSTRRRRPQALPAAAPTGATTGIRRCRTMAR